VIVVDDGSSDDTYDQALTPAGGYPRCMISLIRKANGGKWSALNLASAYSRGLILCIDVNSAPDLLRFLVPKILRPGVVVVAGQVTIRNRVSALTRMQSAEICSATAECERP
jgi:cellulose synthase/poly-beta-1,6-N-acetylglucosamine synthase-like glycosyltransferase